MRGRHKQLGMQMVPREQSCKKGGVSFFLRYLKLINCKGVI